MNMMTRVVATAILALASVLGVGVVAPASAYTYPQFRSGTMETSEFGFFYNSQEYGYGSVSDFWNAVSNLSGYKFLGTGAGKGQYVKNNAAAVYNADPDVKARVYYNSNYSGKYDTIDQNWKGNLLVALKNENASYKWLV